MDDDEWINDHFPNEKRRLHALGLTNVYWNQCENGLFWLFVSVSGLSDTVAWPLVHDLGDVAISNRITAFVDIKKFDPTLKAAIVNVLDVYDTCRLNRNQLTHFYVVPFVDYFKLARAGKKPEKRDGSYFQSDLTDIRRVVEEITGLDLQRWVLHAMMQAYDPERPGPWPPTLHVPAPLWTPPPPIQPKRQRQH